MLDKSQLAWIDFSKLKPSEHIQLLGDKVKIKGPVIIHAPIRLTHRVSTHFFAPLSLGIGLLFFLFTRDILRDYKKKISDKTYRHWRWGIVALSVASAGLAFLIFHQIDRHLAGIYLFKERDRFTLTNYLIRL